MLNTQAASRTYIAPIRDDTTNNNVVTYNSSTNEINTNSTLWSGLNSRVATNTNNITSINATLTINTANYTTSLLGVNGINPNNIDSGVIYVKRNSTKNASIVFDSNVDATNNGYDQQVFEWHSTRYYTGSNSNRSNAYWQFGLRQENDSNLDRLYLGRAGVSSNDWVLTTNGRMGLGLSSPSYQLQLSINSAGKPSSSTWTINSDRRIKENIQPADLNICYNVIKDINMYRYRLIDKYTPDLYDRNQLGFIADEVQTIYPKCVKEQDTRFLIKKGYNPDGTINESLDEYETLVGFKSLDIDQLVKSLFGCVKKLINKVEALESRLNGGN